MKTLSRFLLLLLPAGMVFTACEGPMGNQGADANETCKLCHNSEIVETKATEFDFSKHSFGEAAFEEAGNTGCTPCHTSQAFKYVVKNNVPSTFTLVSGKYVNDYATNASNALGEFNCFTCHPNLHTTYTGDDFFPLTTTAPVAMTMWKGNKTIDLKQDDSKSNLCVKCHQPRPLTTSSSSSGLGDVVDYAALVANPTALFYDNAVTTNKVTPSYRTHVHYGTAGAVFAGQGGIQFAGSKTYTNSAHTTVASCEDCHMAPVTGRTGGHTFYAKGNFNGCNVSGCHTGVTATSTTLFTAPRASIKTLLNTLATKINAVGAGTDILHKNTDPETNLWSTLTTNAYDGYLNIYDPSTNPTGAWKNPSSGSFTNDQKIINNALPTFPSLKNVTMGAMVNFQMVLRDFSQGIHNFKYSEALLTNSIEALTAAGY
jgi:hypothetical protein